MEIKIRFEPNSQSHQWNININDAKGKWFFGCAVDAKDEIEALQKINLMLAALNKA